MTRHRQTFDIFLSETRNLLGIRRWEFSVVQNRFRVKKVSVVADRGMISKELIAALESEARGCQYILWVRVRSIGEVEENVLRDKSPCVEIQPERERAKDPSSLTVLTHWASHSTFDSAAQTGTRRST